jgi:succinyl-CoA synthetase beta subunit
MQLFRADPYLHFDPFAAPRQRELHELRDRSMELPAEFEAEKEGVFYIKLGGGGSVGGFGYGAGLAMSTMDAVVRAGGQVRLELFFSLLFFFSLIRLNSVW